MLPMNDQLALFTPPVPAKADHDAPGGSRERGPDWPHTTWRFGSGREIEYRHPEPTSPPPAAVLGGAWQWNPLVPGWRLDYPRPAVLPRSEGRRRRPARPEAPPAARLPRDRPPAVGRALPALRPAERRVLGRPWLARLERPQGGRGLRGGGGGRPSLLRPHGCRRAGAGSPESPLPFHAVGRRLLQRLRRDLLERLPGSLQRLLPAAGEGRRPLNPRGGPYSAQCRSAIESSPRGKGRTSPRREAAVALSPSTFTQSPLPGVRRGGGPQSPQRIGDCPRHRS